MTASLEFWPEYEGGPLWNERGASLDLGTLPLPANLRDRVIAWSRLYGDDKLPMEDLVTSSGLTRAAGY